MVKIKAGPELDLAVSAVVYNTFYHQRRADECPHYSTDLNAAFAAAEKVGLFSGACGLSRDTPTRWSACKQDCILGIGPTPALAICAAILELREPRRGRG